MEIRDINSTNMQVGQGSQSIGAKPQMAEKTPETRTVEAPKKEKEAESYDVKEKENSGQASASTLQEAIKKINVSANNCEAVFGIHEGTDRVFIKIVDKDTREMIKEYPAEKTLDLIAKAWEMAGIFVDEER